ncbi:hypothetical protein SAMD00019534_007630 [Acytostelium subglobosum LB1]|uniref:hypothetical protein n=1 Tax=Acytostelium subglobosum LB1 TaxID=1410327 RepID=UPI000644BE58|nr:hypothetical protein SAMD00019534_007630 [Acytostelium subglobosum LB1]GAM17588.1 hypothetical protein SAMD00019534_007630 [Acytostelium subglobosum LB1]|eukprot:XP_012759650.1 hypothetical protein SAMD00019534_007630 [Acytostelium subglobosum LB1]
MSSLSMNKQPIVGGDNNDIPNLSFATMLIDQHQSSVPPLSSSSSSTQRPSFQSHHQKQQQSSFLFTPLVTKNIPLPSYNSNNNGDNKHQTNNNHSSIYNMNSSSEKTSTKDISRMKSPTVFASSNSHLFESPMSAARGSANSKSVPSSPLPFNKLPVTPAATSGKTTIQDARPLPRNSTNIQIVGQDTQAANNISTQSFDDQQQCMVDDQSDIDLEYPMKLLKKLLESIDEFEYNYHNNEAIKLMLNEKIVSLGDELRNKEDSIKAIQNENHLLRLKFNDLETQMNKVEVELKSTKLLNKAIQESLEQYEDKRSSIDQLADKVERRSQETNEYIQNAACTIEKMSGQIILHEETIKEKSQTEISMQKDLDCLRMEYEREIKDCQDKILKNKIDLSSMESDQKTLLNKKSTIEKELQLKRDELDKQSRYLEATNSRLQELVDQVSLLQETITQKDVDTSSLKHQLSGLTSQYEKDIQKQQEQTQELKAKNMTLNDEKDRMVIEIEELQATNESQRVHLESVEKECTSLLAYKDEHINLEKELKTAKERNEYLTNKMESSSVRILYLEKEMETQFEENRRLISAKNQLEDDQSLLLSKNTEKDQAIQSYVKRLSDLETDLDKSYKDRDLQSKKLTEKNIQLNILEERNNLLKMDKERLIEHYKFLDDQKVKEVFPVASTTAYPKNVQAPVNCDDNPSLSQLEIVPYIHNNNPISPLPPVYSYNVNDRHQGDQKASDLRTEDVTVIATTPTSTKATSGKAPSRRRSTKAIPPSTPSSKDILTFN